MPASRIPTAARRRGRWRSCLVRSLGTRRRTSAGVDAAVAPAAGGRRARRPGDGPVERGDGADRAASAGRRSWRSILRIGRDVGYGSIVRHVRSGTRVRERAFEADRTGTPVRCQPLPHATPKVPSAERMFDFRAEHPYDGAMTDPQVHAPASRPTSGSRGSASAKITARQRQVLDFIEQQLRERGYPPSVREIGEAIGLTSPSTVHSHLNTLQRLGYLRRDPTKPRAIEVRWDPNSGAVHGAPPGAPRPARRRRRRRHRRARRGERRGAAPGPGRLHRRRRAVHAAGARRLDDRRRHPRRRLRDRRPAADRGRTATSSSPASPAARRRSRRYSARNGSVTLTPSNATMEPMVFDASRRRDLRPGRHRHAPPLTALPRRVDGLPSRRCALAGRPECLGANRRRTERSRRSSAVG